MRGLAIGLGVMLMALPAAFADEKPEDDAPQRVTVRLTEYRFAPARIELKTGQETELTLVNERLRTEALRAGGKKKDGTAVARPATPSDSGTTSEGAVAAPRAAAPSAAGASPGSDRAKPAPRGPASNKDSEPKRKLSGVAPDNVDRPNLSPSSN